MAPQFQYFGFRKVLFFSLFLSFLFVSSFFVIASSSSVHETQQTQIHTRHFHIFGGRRYLLEKIVSDEDEDEQPKKKKVVKTLDDDEDVEVLPKQKKKSSSIQDEEEEILPKKKKKSTSFEDEEEIQPKKKKKSLSSEQEDEDLLAKKKKKSLSFEQEDEDLLAKKKKKSDEDLSSKKKKSFSSEQEDEDLLAKKKKVSSLEQEDEDLVPKKKKKSSSLEQEDEDLAPKKKKVSSEEDLVSTKTKKSSSSSEKDIKFIKPKTTSSTTKNQTKLIKPSTKNVDDSTPTLTKTKTKKLNSTSSSKSQDSSKISKSKSEINTIISELSKPIPTKEKQKQKQKNNPPPPPSPPSWLYNPEDDDDLVSEFRDMPTKFQQTLIPDLHKISTTSKIYLSKANKQITKNFKHYVGNKYAATMATFISCAFIIVPFLLVSLLFNQIKAFFSLQRLIIFVQIYLSIYFSILCFSALVTGLEPLRFFYATSQSTYVWIQVLQTLGYVLYLLLLIMYLVLVFSTDTNMAQKLLGLGQTIVGLVVGLHYYMTVFHRVILHQPPKTNWKVHGIYATCFLVICLFARAERRKKAYPEEGGEEGKQS